MLLNCDLGESWEMQRSGQQRRLLELVDLANVCCGAHAGDAELLQATMAEAAAVRERQDLRVGAHPGYPDPEHFGRRNRFRTLYTAADVRDLVAEQVGKAQEAAAAEGLVVWHVKPHGALYNEAAVEPELAQAIADGVRLVAPGAVLVGLAGAVVLDVFSAAGFRVLREAFADRRYTADGLLVPRTAPGAMIESIAEALAQRDRLAAMADTICVHGDGPQALEFAQALARSSR